MRKFTPEHRKKLSLAHLGKKMSDEHKEKISQSNKKMIFTVEHRRKISESKMGVGNANWKGGISKERARIWGSREYKEWRKKVFERDFYTCVLCGHMNKKGKRKILNADHIKPFAIYIELRFDVNNGRTLCIDCHRKTPTYGVKKKKNK